MNPERQIFISYSWQDSTIVDEIENQFLSIGINLMRDIRDISYRESIYNFMKKIRKSDFIIMIISDSYLKSLSCMNEVIELIKDDDFKDRILHILPYTDLKKADIYNPTGRLRYIEFWQKEYSDFKLKVETIEDINKGQLISDLKKYLSISSSISEFLSVISDMRYIPYDELKNTSYRIIIEQIGFENKNLITELLLIEKLKSIDEKEIKIDSLIYEYPNNFIIYLFKGIYLYNNGSNKKAIFNLQKSIELNSNNPIAYTYIGGAYDELKEFEMALLYYKKSIELNANWNLTYVWQGFAFDYVGKHSEAEDSYKKAIEMNPFSINELKLNKELSVYKEIGIKKDRLLFNRALAFDSTKEYELAISDYNKAIAINPMIGNYYYNRGLAFFNLNKYDFALADFNKAIEVNPNDGCYFNARGLYYYMRRKYSKAENDWIKCIEISPEEPLAYINLMDLYVVRNRIKLALELIETFKNSIPTPEEELLYYFMVNVILVISKKDNKDFQSKFYDSPTVIKTFELFHVELDNYIQNISNFEIKTKLIDLTKFLKSKQITPLPNNLG